LKVLTNKKSTFVPDFTTMKTILIATFVLFTGLSFGQIKLNKEALKKQTEKAVKKETEKKAKESTPETEEQKSNLNNARKRPGTKSGTSTNVRKRPGIKSTSGSEERKRPGTGASKSQATEPKKEGGL